MKHLMGSLVRQVQNQLKDVQEKSEQVHVALLALTESESFDVVLGAAPSGLEALKRLVRRWDPLRGGKRRALLRQISVPIDASCKTFPQDLRIMGRAGPPIRKEQIEWKDDNTKPTQKPARASPHSRQLHQRSPQNRWRWTASAREARKARRPRKEKVMVRASRKKVNIRSRTRIQVRTLFVGTARRTAI